MLVPFDHFNAIAAYYDRMGEVELSDEFIRNLDPKLANSLLDAGGGTGRVAAALRGMVGSITILDASPNMLQYAHRKVFNCVRAAAELIPFQQGYFDRIIMVDAFHHVKNQWETANELFRVLKPGGRLLISEPDIHRFGVKLLAVGEKLLLMRSHILGEAEIAGLFEQFTSQVRVVKEKFQITVVVEKENRL